MKLLERLGSIGFYLASQAFYLYLRHSERTRIVVVRQGRVLALKNWLSDGRWLFPGGGLHAGEAAVAGALRELFEETGIRAMSQELTELGSGQYHLHGLHYSFRAYVLRLSEEPSLRRQRIEVSRLEWLRADALTARNASPDVLQSLILLQRQHPDFLIQ